MISIITCSIKPDICQRMLESISKTIGMEYEAIAFDNREKKYGICKAYNEAAKEAKGDYLCFVHEDIIIKTSGWGKELVKFAEQNSDCGAIGIAGGKWANRNFINWCVSDHLVKVYDDKNQKKDYCENSLVYSYVNPDDEIFSKAVCLDGVFLFVKKNIWENNKFDEETFKDFHFYDEDFTFSISQKCQNYVYFGMDIYHFSARNVERTYCENMYLFQKKWKNKLPYCISGYKVSFRKELERAMYVFSLYRKNTFSRIESLKRIYEINGILFLVLFLLGCIKRKINDKSKLILLIPKLILLIPKRYFLDPKIKDYKKIPIVINNRNHYPYLKKLIEFLERKGYLNIIILDNGSTYRPLLEYYKKIPYRIIYLNQNLGHMAINKCSLFDELKNNYYVLTDPDVLPIEDCPEDFMKYFLDIMNNDIFVDKVGFSLKIDDLPDRYNKKQQVIEWEKRFWQNEVKPGVYKATIDTTFALHRPDVKSSFLSFNYITKHYRTSYPYSARHLPWYEDPNNLPDDINYYYKNTFTGINNW